MNLGMPHKFIGNSQAPKYGVVVFCEYCGAIVFYDNQPDNPDYVKVRGSACPNSPVIQKQPEDTP